MLTKIQATNFQSWKKMEFEVQSGVVMLDGWNADDQTSEGSGKSAVPNALSWTAYGKIPKDANVDDVIKHGETSAEGRLTFSSGDQIVRSRKPNDLYIQKFNGNVIKGKDAKETQEIIDEYLGMNFETFCQSVYFAQNYDRKFLPSNQADKGKILSSIQNLQVFDKARKETMDLIKIETDKQSTLRHQIELENSNVRNFHSQKSLIEQYIQEKIQKHKNDVAMVTHQKSSITQTIQKIEQDLSTVQTLIQSIDVNQLAQDEQVLSARRVDEVSGLNKIQFEKSQVDVVTKSIKAKENEGNTIAARYNYLQSMKQQNQDVKNHPTYLRLLSDATKASQYQQSPTYVRLESKRKALVDYLANPTKNCPSCGNELKNIDLSHTEKEFQGIEREMSEIALSSAQTIEGINKQILSFEIQFKQECDSRDSEINSTLAQLQVIGEFLDQNAYPDLANLNAGEASIKQTIQSIDQALQSINQKKQELTKYQNDVTVMDRSLAQYRAQERQYEESLKSMGEPNVQQDYAKLSVLNDQSQDAALKAAQMAILLAQCVAHTERLEQLKEGFKEIKSYVFGNALKELNFRTNEYLKDLFEVDAKIKFTTEDQKIESRIVLNGRETSLGLLSGGQNRRFNLAVDLALSDIVGSRKSSELNLMILDEYFKDLSEGSMEKCLELLKSRKSPVVLIEHNSIFKDIVNNTFFVRLENGTSFEAQP